VIEEAKLLRIFLGEGDKLGHKALYEVNIEQVGALFLEYVMAVTPTQYKDAVDSNDNLLGAKYQDVFEARPKRNIAMLFTDFDRSFCRISEYGF